MVKLCFTCTGEFSIRHVCEPNLYILFICLVHNIYLPYHGVVMEKTSKYLVVVAVVLFSYLLLYLILSQFFIRQPRNMFEVMQQMMGSQQTIILNIVSLLLAIGIGISVMPMIKTKEPARGLAGIRKELHKEKDSILKEMKEKELKIIKRALSRDESLAISEIEHAGKITQDSLRARLGWSKAKASTILTNLDKMNLIQRERAGKTYFVFLAKKKK